MKKYLVDEFFARARAVRELVTRILMELLGVFVFILCIFRPDLFEEEREDVY